jgi:hypothetical protein
MKIGPGLARAQPIASPGLMPMAPVLAKPRVRLSAPGWAGAGHPFRPQRCTRVTLPARPMPNPTAQVAPYVEALGLELAVEFLLQFGGAELHFAADPRGTGAVEKLVGADKAKALAESRNQALQKRVPLAKRWLARMLHWQGHSTAQIARTLRATDVSVRGWLKDGAA